MTQSMVPPSVSGVALVRWPDDTDHLDRLRSQGRPRLLLVDPGSPAPYTTALDEDWIRLPASEEDLHARSVALAAKAALVATNVPTVSGDGRLVHRGSWVALSPIEEQIVATLVADFGELVPLTVLTGGVADHVLTPNAVRVHVMRLRKRIAPMGLAIQTVHGRGYLLETSP